VTICQTEWETALAVLPADRRARAMTNVIAQPRIGVKDSSLEVCAVDCIHPTEDDAGSLTSTSFIDP
jgi:hypothetical protein